MEKETIHSRTNSIRQKYLLKNNWNENEKEGTTR